MADHRYNDALKAVLVYEGGWSDHPRDPGGATMKGVTQRVYDSYRKRSNALLRSVREITPVEIETIYRRQYWAAVRGDDLPAGVDFAMFDGAVNSGPSQAIKWLQRALQGMKLYSGKIDGTLREVTMAAVGRVNDHDALVAAICARRLAFCRALKTWADFGRGWSARIANVLKKGQAWATGSVGPDPVYASGMEARASIEDAKPLPSKAAADVIMTTGATTAATTQGAGLDQGTLDKARETLEPLVGAAPWLGHVVAAITIASVGMVVGGAIYRWWLTRKAVRRADVLDLPTGVTA